MEDNLAGSDDNLVDSNDLTALMQAAHSGHADTISKLIEKGVDVNLVNNDGESALIAAAYYDHTDAISVLIEKGADVNHADKIGMTALIGAAINGHTDAISMLIEKGADVNLVENTGCTALKIASEQGHNDVKELLLENRTKVNAKDDEIKTTLIKKIICKKCLNEIDIDSIFCNFCGKKVEDFEEIKSSNEKIEDNLSIGDKNFWFNRGISHIATNDYRKAIEAFNNAIETDNNFAEAWYQIGLVYGSTYKYEEAITALNTASMLDPNFSKALKMLGLTCESLKKYKDAENAFLKYLELNNDDKEIWDRLGNVYRAQGKIIAAMKAFSKGSKG